MQAVREYAGALKGCRINRTPIKTETGYAPLYLEENDTKGIQEFLEKHNRTDVYYTIYAYYGEDKNTCPILAPLYFDFDDDHVEENYEEERSEVLRTVGLLKQWFKVPEEMVEIYFSGHKGFHVIVPSVIFGLSADEHLNEKLKLVMQRVRQNLSSERIDRRIYDRKRLFRIPNTINSKSGLYKIPLNIDWLRRASFQDICKLATRPQLMFKPAPKLIPEAKKAFEEWLKTQSAATNKTTKKAGEYKIPDKEQELLPCVKAILQNGASEGQRNNTTVALASSLLQSGRKFETVEKVLTEWNEYNDPPLAPVELHTTLMSAYSMLQNGKRYGCGAFRDLGLCLGTECSVLGSNREEIARGNSKWQMPSPKSRTM